MSAGMSLNSFCDASTLVPEKENIYRTQIANGIKKKEEQVVFFAHVMAFAGMKQDLQSYDAI